MANYCHVMSCATLTTCQRKNVILLFVSLFFQEFVWNPPEQWLLEHIRADLPITTVSHALHSLFFDVKSDDIWGFLVAIAIWES